MLGMALGGLFAAAWWLIKQHSLLITAPFFSLFALHHRAKIPHGTGLTFFCS
ncbi:MAG: hypothetical protein PW844_26220 [Pantoea sp.]|uniref:hypothetical protein n=1 Tax=Pantoea sp. TaxID=69393 RepID=UPI00239B4895|nr:hypothetical protein [Pantoea sp.]MDE1189917.1 hypothetical protein [Pantoea sp.]